MRLFKFFAVFAIILGLVYIVVIGLNMNVFKSVFTNQEALAEGSEWVEKTFSLSGLVDFIEAHPDLVSVTLSDTSTVGKPDTTAILFQATQPRAMAGTGHLILLATYARLVQEGVLSKDQIVSDQEISRFVIPGQEPSKHRETMRLLSEMNGNQDNFTLDSVVQAMVMRNHQPSADAVYSLLGVENIEHTLAESGFVGIETPALWSAFHIAHAISKQENNYITEYSILSGRLLSDGNVTATTLLQANNITTIEYSFLDEKQAYRMLPTTTPESMSLFMVWMLDSNRFGSEASELVKSHLSWPMRDTKVTRDFTELYAIYDNRISISHGVAVGTSAYTNRTQVSTVYFDHLPVGFWMHMSSNLINQDYQMRLMYDPALYERSFSLLQSAPATTTQPETNSEEQQL